MATSQYKPFATIHGLSNQVRIPRLGRIRLGHTNYNTNNGKKHGVEDPFFQVPPEVQEVYGSTPTELDILLPANDRTIVFPQALEYYGSSTRPLCTGNGQEARRWDQEKLTYTSCACPCPLYGKGCGERGHLLVILPKVRNQGGVYQIDTGSKNAIQSINSALNLIAPEGNPDDGLLGFIAMVPMKLKRAPRHIYPEGKHKITYPISLSLAASLEEIEELKKQKAKILAKTQLWIVDTPDRLNPDSDPDAIVTIDEEVPVHVESPLPNLEDSAERPADHSTTLSSPTHDSTVQDPSTPTVTTTSTGQSSPSLSDDMLPSRSPDLPSVLQTHANSPTANTKPDVTSIGGAITAAQLRRILKEAREGHISEEVVRSKTSLMSKREASIVIAQMMQHNYSAFETHTDSQSTLSQSA